MDTAAGRPGEARAGRPSGAPPRCGAAGEPAAGLLRPAQAVKRESDPAPPPCCPPCPCPAAGICTAGWGRAFALWESWCRGIDTAAGRPGEARAGRPGGAPPPLRSSGGPAAGLLRPAQAVKRESDPAPPRKSTCPIYNRIAPPPGAFLHHGGMGGIGWCSGRPSRRPIDT